MIQNSIIAFLSILAGIVSGMVFSRLFLMVVVKILSINIKYYVSPKCFLLSIIFFLITFIIICIQSLLYTSKLEISELLKENRRSEKKSVNKPFYAFLGISLIIGSFILMYLTIIKVIFKTHIGIVTLFMLVTLVGLYMWIGHFGSAVLFILKRKKNIYLKNMITLAEIQYRFRGFKNIIYILTLSAAACIYFIGLTFGSKILFPKNINFQFAYDVMYIETDNVNKLDSKKINKIINESNTPLIDKKDINYILTDMEFVNSKDRFWGHGITVISDLRASRLANKYIDVKKGSALQCISKKSSEYYTDKKNIRLRNKESNKVYTFNYAGVNITGQLININPYTQDNLIVLDAVDFKNVSKESNIKTKGIIHLFKFQETKKRRNFI